MREQAAAWLMAELKKGENSVCSDAGWVSEEEMLAEFGKIKDPAGPKNRTGR